MALFPLAPPAVEPVSLCELKEYLRVDPDDTSQDGVITALGMGARAWVEGFLNRRCVQQTWRLMMDFFPGYIDLKLSGQRVSSPFVSGSNAVLVGIRYAIVLPFPPVQSIVAFVYQDANGDVTEMDPATDYVTDIQSNPARLTPPFGSMWPVARVVVNAVQIDYQLGYASPLTVSVGGSPPVPTQLAASGYTFQPADIGRPISIQGAGVNGGTLNTVIAGISSPPDTNATLRDPMQSGIQNAQALLVNAPYCNPQHWELIKSAIKIHVEGVWRRISPDIYLKQAKLVCYPARDERW